MTSHAPTPRRPTRPCTADLLTESEPSATIAGTAATGPKLPPFVGDGTLASDPDVVASIAELLTAGSLPDTVTALVITDPKLPPYVGD
jgi:hypothetical protein